MPEVVRSALLYFTAVVVVSAVTVVAILELPLVIGMPTVFMVGAGLLLSLWIQRHPSSIAEGAQALRVERVQRQAEMRRTVLYDGDAGLYQRWYMELRLSEESARCVRYGISMALLVVRLNASKITGRAEDGWQSEANQAAFLTAKTVRTVDLSALLGPREFAVCLVHCDRRGANVAAARLEKALRSYMPSVGLVVIPEEKVEPKHLIELARSRAYAAGQKLAA
jgi:GGDEF domain-containing protein